MTKEIPDWLSDFKEYNTQIIKLLYGYVSTHTRSIYSKKTSSKYELCFSEKELKRLEKVKPKLMKVLKTKIEKHA